LVQYTSLTPGSWEPMSTPIVVGTSYASFRLLFTSFHERVYCKAEPVPSDALLPEVPVAIS
jgi:hypothetical protein